MTMTETIAPAPESLHLARPYTDAAALRAIEGATEHVRERAVKIRQCPELHHPKLVLSEHGRGTSILDKIADGVNRFCGSMLDNFASKDMPGRQRHIQDCVDQILAKVGAEPTNS
jgi:hypothetical protein